MTASTDADAFPAVVAAALTFVSIVPILSTITLFCTGFVEVELKVLSTVILFASAAMPASLFFSAVV